MKIKRFDETNKPKKMGISEFDRNLDNSDDYNFNH